MNCREPLMRFWWWWWFSFKKSRQSKSLYLISIYIPQRVQGFPDKLGAFWKKQLFMNVLAFLSFSIHNLMIPKPQLFPPPSKEEEGKGESKRMKRFFSSAGFFFLLKLMQLRRSCFQLFTWAPTILFIDNTQGGRKTGKWSVSDAFCTPTSLFFFAKVAG